MTPHFSHVILVNGWGIELNQQGIEILFNYWEYSSTELCAALDDLKKQNVDRVMSFVPWQALENDICHRLVKFLAFCVEREFEVHLVPSIEPGCSYPYSGVPKEFIVEGSQGFQALDHRGKSIQAVLPPVMYSIPSLHSVEFLRRYFSFLTRLDAVLADTCRGSAKLKHRISIKHSGSFWKYYRNASEAATGPFNAVCGDYQAATQVIFRNRVDQFFSQREFLDEQGSGASWRHSSQDRVNRHWFTQQNEDVFRLRALQYLRRKATGIGVEQIELFTPEADPGNHYSFLFQSLTGSNSDFYRLTELLDAYATRASAVGSEWISPVCLWTSQAGFESMAEAEKQFLILRSLILFGARGGSVWLPMRLWSQLSHSFKRRLSQIAKTFENGDLQMNASAIYLAPSLWSNPTGSKLWNELRFRAGFQVCLASSLDAAINDPSVHLLMIDPDWIFTRDQIEKCLEWARAGRVLVLPKTTLYSERARENLNDSLSAISEAFGGELHLSLGLNYTLSQLGDGKIVLVDLSTLGEVTRENYEQFVLAMMSLSGVREACQVSDTRLKVIPLDKRGGGVGLFVFNRTARAISADLIFQSEIQVSDLSRLWNPQSSQASETDENPVNLPDCRFGLEVPPCGILPLSVDGLGSEMTERRVAMHTSELMKQHVSRAAEAELPGMSEVDQWN